MSAIAANTTTAATAATPRRGGALWRAVRHNGKAAAGTVILAFFVVAAVVPRLFTSVAHPNQRAFDLSLPPSSEHLLGTTAFGQDVWAQLIWGTRQSLIIALVAGALATILSVIIGISAAYLGGAADGILSLLIDVFLVIPAFPLAIVIAAYAGSASLGVVVVVLVITGWSYGARQLRAQALSLRRRDFLESARVRGERPSYIILVEILPTMTSLIAANFLGAALYAVLTEAGLQFIGLGDPSSVSWGTMLHWAQDNEALQTGQEWWVIAPGLCIALLGASFALLNYAFDEIGNPALRPVRRRGRRLAREGEAMTATLADREHAGGASGPLLRVRDLSVAYDTASGPVLAVDGVDLDVERGEFVGIVGESGCGKSTFLFAVAQLLPRTARVVGGSVEFAGSNLVTMTDGELAPVRWRQLSVVMQSAMNALNPVKRISAQFADVLRTHGVRDRAEIRQRSVEVMELVGIAPVHLGSYPHQLSGGMRQRAMIAMALLFSPELVIMDEPTSALDVVAQRSLMLQVKELQRQLGFAVVFVTHDMSLVSHFSDRLMVMYAGQEVEFGPTRAVFDRPRHPYSRGLLDAFPSIRGPRRPLTGIPGAPPALTAMPPGCRYQPRCPQAFDGCEAQVPPLFAVQDVAVRCLLYTNGDPEPDRSTEPPAGGAR